MYLWNVPSTFREPIISFLLLGINEFQTSDRLCSWYTSTVPILRWTYNFRMIIYSLWSLLLLFQLPGIDWCSHNWWSLQLRSDVSSSSCSHYLSLMYWCLSYCGPWVWSSTTDLKFQLLHLTMADDKQSAVDRAKALKNDQAQSKCKVTIAAKKLESALQTKKDSKIVETYFLNLKRIGLTLKLFICNMLTILQAMNRSQTLTRWMDFSLLSIETIFMKCIAKLFLCIVITKTSMSVLKPTNLNWEETFPEWLNFVIVSDLFLIHKTCQSFYRISGMT